MSAPLTHEPGDVLLCRHLIDAELRPCPLCGSDTVYGLELTKPGETYVEQAVVQCGKCGCRISGGSVKDLAVKWDRRAGS